MTNNSTVLDEDLKIKIKSNREAKRSGFSKRRLRRRRVGVRHIPEPPFTSRRAIVQFRVLNKEKSPELSTITSRKHLRYLTRDGVCAETGCGLPFNDFSDKPCLKRFNRLGEGELDEFRGIISPEDNAFDHNIDMKQMTRELMLQMEKDLRRKVNWIGVVHGNTDQPHVHLVIRGRDQQGEDLWIDPEYIKNGFRRRVANWMTDEIGPRKKIVIGRSLNQEIKADRKTSIDRKLEEIIKTHGNEKPLIDFGYIGRHKAEAGYHGIYRLVERTEYLKQKGLVDINNNIVTFKEGWADTLKKEGERHDIIKQMYRDRIISSKDDDVEIYKENELNESILGVVVDKGLSNELYDRHQVTLNAGNKMIRVELKGDASEYIDEIKVGSYMKFDVESKDWQRPADTNIVEVAEKNNGIYDRNTHLGMIKTDKVSVDLGAKKIEVPKEDFVDSHVKRLKKQAYFKLAKSLGEDKFEIPEDYLEQMAGRVEKKVSWSVLPPLAQRDVTKRFWTTIDDHIDQYDHSDKRLNRLVNARRDFLRDELKIDIDNMDKKEFKKAIRDVVYNDMNKEWDLKKTVVGKIESIEKAPMFKDKKLARIKTGEQTHVDVVLNKNHEELKIGEYVRFNVDEKPWLKPADANIVQVAEQNDGIYEADRHAAAITCEKVTVETPDGKSIMVEKDEFIQAHINRLGKQANNDLAEKIDEGKYRIPRDYLERMEGIIDYSRSRSVGNFDKDNVQQRQFTWLDRNLDQAGADSDIGKAAAQRKIFLQETLKLNVDDPKKLMYALKKIERNDLIDQLKHETGYNYRRLTEEIIEGTLERRGDHAAVVDHRAKKFSLVEWREEYEKNLKKTMSLSMSNRVIVMKAVELGRGGPKL